MGIETIGGQLAFAEQGWTCIFQGVLPNILKAVWSVWVIYYATLQFALTHLNRKSFTRRNIVTGDFLPLRISNCIASIGLIEEASQSTPTFAKMVRPKTPVEPLQRLTNHQVFILGVNFPERNLVKASPHQHLEYEPSS